MSPAVGSKLNHYIIDAQIGAGGMGEVFRAKDTRLDRHVALKVLPEHLARDAERMLRFQREAKTLASLNHPNVAQIHGFEDDGDTRFLVMEFVPGDTLADRLLTGPLSIEEALNVCAQIAAGLEAAHEAGVIHRDLKPGNVILTRDGKAKVLDFGLARQEQSKRPSGTGTVGPLTEEGVLLGTPGFMSPEQVRGKAIDRRTDIFTFACVLYDCLTGQPAFPGETAGDVLAAILFREPDYGALPSGLSPRLRELLAKCFEKDPAHRLRDIGDARIELQRAIANKEWGTARLATVSGGSGKWRTLVPWISSALIGAFATALVLHFAAPKLWSRAITDASARPIVSRFVVNPPGLAASGEFDTTATLAISPDGSAVAFLGRQQQDAEPMLYVRKLDGLEASAVPGGLRAHDPVFSWDSKWICSSASERLWKVPVDGGARVELARLPGFHKGSCWGKDGILCAPAPNSGLFRVPADGGELAPVSTLDASKSEVSQRWPELLPDGRHVLCTIKTVGTASFDEAEIAVYSLDTRVWKTVVRGGYFSKYVESGHLVFARDGDLFAAPFDLERLETTAQPTRVLTGVMMEPRSGAAQFDVSKNGTLVYAPGGSFEPLVDLVWIHRDGTESPVGMPARPYSDMRLSPDGKRIAVVIAGATDALFIYDIARGTLSRATFEGNTGTTSWMPDGETLFYYSDREGGGLFRSRIDGTGTPVKVLPPVARQSELFSAGGRQFVFYSKGPPGERDIWSCGLEPGAVESPLIQTKFDQFGAQLSPDGKWLAYISDESGRSEIYVTTFPPGQGRWQVSRDGAETPRWSPDGKELCFTPGVALVSEILEAPRTLASVSVSGTTAFEAGPQKKIFEWTGRGLIAFSPDGERLLVMRGREPKYRPTEIRAVLNWVEELKHKVPLR